MAIDDNHQWDRMGLPLAFGSGTHLMVPVGDLHVIHEGDTSRKGLRSRVRPMARLPLVLPPERVAVFNSPEQRQNPHHQMCARAKN